MTDKLVINLDPAAGFIQVEGDAERKVTVLGAERAEAALSMQGKSDTLF